MRAETEKVLRVKSLAKDVTCELLTDGTTFSEQDLKRVVELLAHSVQDFANLYANIETDHETTLKATIAKMRIAKNTLQLGKIKQSSKG